MFYRNKVMCLIILSKIVEDSITTKLFTHILKENKKNPNILDGLLAFWKMVDPNRMLLIFRSSALK